MTKQASRKDPAKKRTTSEASRAANQNGGNLGFEQKLWQAADKMRGHMDAAEYKHVALGLIFLKYISDAFEQTYHLIEAGEDEMSKEFGQGNPKDRDEYEARNVFWVPSAARWNYLQKNAKQTGIGNPIDHAMVAIERDHPKLKGVLPKEYTKPALDKHRLGELIDLIGTITLNEAGGDAGRSRDILGRIYGYFLGKFAEKEEKGSGGFHAFEFKTTPSIKAIEHHGASRLPSLNSISLRSYPLPPKKPPLDSFQATQLKGKHKSPKNQVKQSLLYG